MPQATFRERRERFRAILARPALTSPASTFSPVSARLAAAAGFEFGLLGGSVASAEVLGAPDLAVITLSEFAEQARRITRASDLPLMVDSDHGYGNALSVRRTVEELEAAGVAAMSIEDTVLPQPYGVDRSENISVDEFRGKLRAAVDARTDPSLVVIGRTNLTTDTDDVIARIQACSQAGVDCIFLIGRLTSELLTAIHSASSLPLITGYPQIDPQELISLGVRIQTTGHQGYFVMLQALWSYYQARQSGRPTGAFLDQELSPEQRRIAFDRDAYEAWTREYLGISGDGPTRL